VTGAVRAAISRKLRLRYFVTALALQLLTHWNLISLPFFWDEAGYYVPAAHDLFAKGTPIPLSVPSNAPPPLLSLYVSAWW
jgi:hypothetical protein